MSCCLAQVLIIGWNDYFPSDSIQKTYTNVENVNKLFCETCQNNLKKKKKRE